MKLLSLILFISSCGIDEDTKAPEDLITDTNETETIDEVESEDTQKIAVESPTDTIQLACTSEYTGSAYDRDEWGNWSTKGDLQNVRHQVLLEESLTTGECKDIEPIIQDDKVLFGCWQDLYTNTIYKDSSDLDIDHLVPLKEAFDSGAYDWTKEKKKEYYNYMKDANHLIAVESGLNRSKGSKDVGEWLPTQNVEIYVSYWINIKATWGLSIDSNELDILKQYSNDPRLPNSCR